MELELEQSQQGSSHESRMFTRSIVIQRRVEDIQLGVESYQKRLNLTKPDTDGTLNDVHTALDDRLKGIRMRCSWCEGPVNSGNCRRCTNVSFGDEPVYDSNTNSYNQTPDFSNPFPHHNYETNSRSDTGVAFQAEFAKLQQNFERFMAQQSCSYCDGLFNGVNYSSRSIIGAENEFVHDLNLFPYDNTPDFYDQPPQHHVETYSCELCGNNFHYGYDCPPHEGPHANFQCQPRNQNYFEPNPSYNYNSSSFNQPPQYSIDHQEDLNQQRINDVDDRWNKMIEAGNKLMQFLGEMILQREQNEDLNTIPETESDEVMMSSVEDLVLIASESEDTSVSDSECDLPARDDFSPINFPEGKFVTFSNPLFDSNDDFISSDDESLFDKHVSKDNVKIYSNSLFEFDDEYISTDVNPLFDEVLEDIKTKDSYVSNLNESALLFTPLFYANEDECFDPGGYIDEINAFDIPSDFEDGYYDSKGDVLYLESLLSDDTTPNLPLELFLDRDPRSLSDINDLKIMVKVFDFGIHEKIISTTYVSLPFKDRHYLFLTYVIRIFLPYFIYPVDSPFLLSSRSEDTLFDPDISAFHFSSL
nr:hypothetical protein [Tanacetum cinerariifolium]